MAEQFKRYSGEPGEHKFLEEVVSSSFPDLTCSGSSEAKIDDILDSGLCVRALGRDRLKRKGITCLTPLYEAGLTLVLPYAMSGKLWLESTLLLRVSLFLSFLNAEIECYSPPSNLGLLVTCQSVQVF